MKTHQSEGKYHDMNDMVDSQVYCGQNAEFQPKLKFKFPAKFQLGCFGLSSPFAIPWLETRASRVISRESRLTKYLRMVFKMSPHFISFLIFIFWGPDHCKIYFVIMRWTAISEMANTGLILTNLLALIQL